MKDQASINHLHECYCLFSGMSLTLTLPRIFCWEAWMLKGWTAGDLELVISRLKIAIIEKKRFPSSLYFSRLIRDVDFFEELLSEARALSRRPVVNHARQQVLRATHRTEEPKTGFKNSAEVLASDAFKALLAVRDGVATILIASLLFLCGCENDKETLDAQKLVEEYHTAEVRNLPGHQSKFIVRDTNGCIWYVNLYGYSDARTKLFESNK